MIATCAVNPSIRFASAHWRRSGRRSPSISSLFVEKIGVSSCANEDDEAGFAAVVRLVGQQKIATDVALAMAVPLALERVIKPFRPEGAIVSDQQQHDLFEPVHVEPAGAR